MSYGLKFGGSNTLPTSLLSLLSSAEQSNIDLHVAVLEVTGFFYDLNSLLGVRLIVASFLRLELLDFTFSCNMPKSTGHKIGISDNYV